MYSLSLSLYIYIYIYIGFHSVLTLERLDRVQSRVSASDAPGLEPLRKALIIIISYCIYMYTCNACYSCYHYCYYYYLF